jgi:hypothetical protein
MQDTVAITIVLVATAYLAWLAWQRLVRAKGKCGSCPSCGTDDPIKTRPLVNISLEAPRK